MTFGIDTPIKAGPGRPKGLQNKVTTQIKDMVIQALSEAGGVDYLVRQAEEEPQAFLTLVGKVLPTQLHHSGEDGRPLVIYTGVPRAEEPKTN